MSQGFLHNRDGDSGVFRCSRAWRHQYPVIPTNELRDIFFQHIIVSDDIRGGTQLMEITVEGINETVVVVDDQNVCHDPAVSRDAWEPQPSNPVPGLSKGIARCAG